MTLAEFERANNFKADVAMTGCAYVWTAGLSKAAKQIIKKNELSDYNVKAVVYGLALLEPRSENA